MSDLKRLILILGGKGGTGKTLHCRQLFYFLVSSGVKTQGFDADIENPEFSDYHSSSPYPVRTMDFLETGEAKELFTIVAQELPDVVLVDMPGASGKDTRQQLERFGAFKIAEKLGYRITIDTVLNNAYNTIGSLRSMLDYCGSRADFVAVKSQMWCQGTLTFNRWDNSNTREEFLKLGGTEIEMPLLELSTFDEMHENNLSFFDKEKLRFGDQILLESFLDLSRPSLEKAARYLGLPWVGETLNGKSGKRANATKPKAVTEMTEKEEVVSG